jgi:hypothetical protein
MTQRPTLWTYCIPYDDGAAPNPYWGVCTLAICKPFIRRGAQVGDWVVGTGSKHSPIGDASGRVVYAMRVSRKLSMAEYDVLTRRTLTQKLPVWTHRDRRRRLGDSIYDFEADPPTQRLGVHLEGNRTTDLRGLHVLLSDHFHYFGDHPQPLPDDLVAIVKQGQGHRSVSNAPYVGAFVSWLEHLGIKPNKLRGKPQLDLFKDEDTAAACANHRRDEALEDERLERSGLGDP